MGTRSKEAYRRHYRDYQGRPDQLKEQAQRHAARNKLIKQGVVRKGDGKDVHHKAGLEAGNGRSNLAIVPKSKNRGYKRDSRNQPI